MTGWKLVRADERGWWDTQLLRAVDATVFQSFGWGEFKRHEGWTPQRFVHQGAGGQAAGMVQLLAKRLPLGLSLAWAPGGPVVQFEGARADEDLPGLLAAIRQAQPRALVRFDCSAAQDDRSSSQFAAHCRRPAARLNSGVTIRFQISGGPEEFAGQMTSKHRYYVRKAEKASLRWESDCNDTALAAFEALHRDMSANKGIAVRAFSAARLSRLRDALGPDGMTLLTGYLTDRPVTACLTLNFGPKSFYFLAATGEEGRRVGAAYAMLPRLIEELRQKGIREFDFGGIAPGSAKSAGVDHFKKGFGGGIVETVGEWEWSNVPLLAPAAGLLMKYRGLAA